MRRPVAWPGWIRHRYPAKSTAPPPGSISSGAHGITGQAAFSGTKLAMPGLSERTSRAVPPPASALVRRPQRHGAPTCVVADGAIRHAIQPSQTLRLVEKPGIMARSALAAWFMRAHITPLPGGHTDYPAAPALHPCSTKCSLVTLPFPVRTPSRTSKRLLSSRNGTAMQR